MSEEWGPWVEHDGKGCPPSLIGRFILVNFRLSHNDEEGGKAGDENFTEAFVSEIYASIPEWDRSRFGEYAENPITGEIYGVADILRYRIRKPLGLTILKDIASDFPAPKQVEMTP